MRHAILLSGLGLTLALGLAWLVPPAATGNADTTLDVHQLLAKPEQHNDKPIVVSAYAVIEFENMALCSHPAQERSESQNPTEGCIWLDIDDGPYESEADNRRYKSALARWNQFNGKRVVVRGTFTGGESGHLGLWRGAMGHVTGVLAQ